MKNLISVVIPIYNVQNYLQKAIDSLLLQKDFLHEIIIVDDGSTDGSYDLLIDLYSKIEIIQIFKKENEGQGLARNYGTEVSTGDFVYYFDSDDILKPDLFKRFYHLLEKSPDLELYCFSAESFLDENFSMQEVTNKGFLSENAYKRKLNIICETGEEAFNELYKSRSFFAVPYLYIFKKSIISNNNIRFRQIKFEDEEFTQQLFVFAGKTQIENKSYYRRRVRKGSAMQKRREFAELMGYFKTIDTFKILVDNNNLHAQTKINLKKRIKTLIRNIIFINAANKIKMSLFQRAYYTRKILPFALSDIYILRIFLTYSMEYKLRKVKQKYWNN